MDYKEIFQQKYDERMEELEARGITGRQAEDLAGEQAYIDMQDRLADIADNARQHEKDNS